MLWGHHGGLRLIWLGQLRNSRWWLHLTIFHWWRHRHWHRHWDSHSLSEWVLLAWRLIAWLHLWLLLVATVRVRLWDDSFNIELDLRGRDLLRWGTALLHGHGGVNLVSRLLRHHITVLLLTVCELILRGLLNCRHWVHIHWLAQDRHLVLGLTEAIVLVLARFCLAIVLWVMLLQQTLLLITWLHLSINFLLSF